MFKANARIVYIALASWLAASQSPAQSFDIPWYTVDGGGATLITGGSFTLSGTIGQSEAGGPLTGGAFSLTGGFWAGVAPGTPAAGDCDGDGDVDLDDHSDFSDCLDGPDGGLAGGCECSDFDADSDVDLRDVAAFQVVFTD